MIERTGRASRNNLRHKVVNGSDTREFEGHLEGLVSVLFLLPTFRPTISTLTIASLLAFVIVIYPHAPKLWHGEPEFE